MSIPLRRVRPPVHRPAVRPAGLLGPNSVGLLLRALGPGTVTVNGTVVTPEYDGSGNAFIPLSEGVRSRVELQNSFGTVQAAWITVKEPPARSLSSLLLPTISIFGNYTRVTAPARVNLVNFPVGVDVAVDGVPTTREGTQWSDLGRVRTVVIPWGRHAITVSRGVETLPVRLGTVNIDVEPGEIVDLVQGDFPTLDFGAPGSIPVPDSSPSPDQEPPPSGTPKSRPRLEDLRPDVVFFPSLPPLSSEAPRATEVPAAFEVGSVTPGARVSIDGVPVSGPPFRAMLAPGEHRIDVSANGYATRTLEVRAESGRAARVQVDLSAVTPVNEPRPPAPRRGRTIALVGLGLGLAAVAGVGIAMALTKPKPPPPPALPASRKRGAEAEQGDGGASSS